MSSGQLSASSRALRWFPWIAIGALLVVRLCHEWFGPDIWYHLALGERIARTGVAQPADNLILQQPDFVNFYWCFQLIARAAFAVGGIHGVSVLFVAVWMATFAFWLRTTGALRSPPWGAILALAAVLVCQVRFEERPEIFSYLFLTLEIYWLANWRLDAPAQPRDLALFALVQVLWSNTHGYFALGPLLVAAKIVSVALGTPRADWPRLRPAWPGLWTLAAFSVAATLASPFGLRNWAGVVTLWQFFGAMRHDVQEFLPPTGAFLTLWPVKLFWLGWFATLFTAVFFLCTAARREIFALLLAAAGLWLSATSFRNIPLLVFLSAPLAGVALQKLAKFRPFERSSSLLVGLAAVALGGLAATRAFAGASFGIRESPVASPVRFAEYLRPTNFHGALFDHPGDGGYLEFQFPNLRLYGDSRYVDVAPVREYFAALHDAETFQQLDARDHFDAALFRVTDSRPVLRELLQGARWRLVYADLHRALLVDAASPAAAAFARESLDWYHGEDLGEHANSEAALQWVGVFAEANDPENLQRVLQAFAAAPRIPAVVIEAALRYALATHRSAIAAMARTLRPKMIVAKPADAEVIDRLLAQSATP